MRDVHKTPEQLAYEIYQKIQPMVMRTALMSDAIRVIAEAIRKDRQQQAQLDLFIATGSR